MTKPLAGLVSLFAQSITHEGAAAFDFSESDPLTWLVFTKAPPCSPTRSTAPQAEELFSYSKALLAAERHERGFGWKFAAYMRDPKLGKGNRIQGANSSCKVGDAAVLFSALMAKQLGYSATFSDKIFVEDLRAGESPFAFAERLKHGQGWGATQVAGSVVSLIKLLLQEPGRARPRTLYFFSDMQFHPPARQKFDGALPARVRSYFTPQTPPLLAALRAYRELLGPVDVVLWNLAAYDNAPLPSGMDGVLMLAGFDANSFRHVTTWQESGSPGALPGNRSATVAAVRDQQAELEYIRQF